MSHAARDGRVRVVFSYPVRDPATNNRYIASSMISPEGLVEITYHKTHPWAYSRFETDNFALGSTIPHSVALHQVSNPINAGIEVYANTLICWDIEFPEPARVVRLQTPGHWSPLLLAVPTANADGDIQEYVLRARAVENHIFIIYANNAGPEFCGGSCIVGPDGRVLAKVDGTGEELLACKINIGKEKYAAMREINPMLDNRRPELYNAISQPQPENRLD